jgi:hypothetical protein
VCFQKPENGFCVDFVFAIPGYAAGIPEKNWMVFGMNELCGY